jgi:succinate dehydrogenase / fumarate reductase flavoprotein subunit
MAELHAKEAPDRVRELEEWGAVFDRTKAGLINQRNFGGHRYPRLAHVGDRTGLEIIRTLQDHGIHQGIDVYMECTGLDFLKDGDKISGMVGMWRETGRFVVFRAKAAIVATGGGGKGWKITSNSWEYSGDGYGMAYEAGAELMDMEFTQFHPTGMVWPPSVRGTLVTESVRGEGGVLLNSEGKRFMFDNIPDRFAAETADTEEEATQWLAGDKDARRPPELLTRDVVARAIRKEVKAGRGSPHGGAFLDIASKRTAEDTSSRCWQSWTLLPNRWKWDRRSITLWGASGWMPTVRCRECRGCLPAENVPPACTAPTASEATLFLICSYSENLAVKEPPTTSAK